MKWLLTISLLLIIGLSYGQRPIFSQYYTTGIYLNPALAGMEQDQIAQANYRSQWNSVGTPFKTFQASYVHPLKQQFARLRHVGGLGVAFFRDVAGTAGEFETNGANITYAHNFQFGNKQSRSKHIITLGTQAGYYQNAIALDAFQWSSQYNSDLGYDGSLAGEFADGELQQGYAVGNAGLLWRFNTHLHKYNTYMAVYNGFAVENINSPDISLFADQQSRLNPLYKMHGGLSFFINKKLRLSPNYLVQVQNGRTQTNTGAFVSYNVSQAKSQAKFVEVILGAWYRLEDSFIFNTGINTRTFNLAFSYDINSSSFGRFNSSRADAYELSLAVKFPDRKRARRYSSPLI